MNKLLGIISAGLLYAVTAVADYVPEARVQLPAQRYEVASQKSEYVLGQVVSIPQLRDKWADKKAELVRELEHLLSGTDDCKSFSAGPIGLSCTEERLECRGGFWESKEDCKSTWSTEYDGNKAKRVLSNDCRTSQVCTGTTVWADYTDFFSSYENTFDVHQCGGFLDDDNLCFRDSSGEERDIDLASEGQAVRAARVLEDLRYVSTLIAGDRNNWSLPAEVRQAEDKVAHLRKIGEVVKCFQEKYGLLDQASASPPAVSNERIKSLSQIVQSLAASTSSLPTDVSQFMIKEGQQQGNRESLLAITSCFPENDHNLRQEALQYLREKESEKVKRFLEGVQALSGK